MTIPAHLSSSLVQRIGGGLSSSPVPAANHPVPAVNPGASPSLNSPASEGVGGFSGGRHSHPGDDAVIRGSRMLQPHGPKAGVVSNRTASGTPFVNRLSSPAVELSADGGAMRDGDAHAA